MVPRAASHEDQERAEEHVYAAHHFPQPQSHSSPGSVEVSLARPAEMQQLVSPNYRNFLLE